MSESNDFNRNSGGMFGGDDGWWDIILMTLLFGRGNGGFGGGNPMAKTAETGSAQPVEHIYF